MHRIKQLLAAGSAALVVTGGALALASSANAATALSFTYSSSGTGSSAGSNSAGDVVLTVGSTSGSFAEATVNSVPTTAPTSAPTLTTDYYSTGSPRWFINFAGGDAVFGYPSMAGLGANNWQVIPASSGACHVTEPGSMTYANALAFIGTSCGGNVTGAGIIADDAQAGTTDTITDISYDGMTPADVVSVTSPGNQTSKVGTAISTLTVKASSNTGSSISSFAASGLPSGLSIDATTGAITGTPTTAGTSSVKVTATDAAGTTGSTTFSWTVSTTGPTTTYNGPIHLVKMGLCLDDRGNSKSNGAVVQVWKCKGNSNQVWQVESDGTIRHNGLCLDARGYGTTSGTRVQLWSCSGGPNQKWDTKGWRVHYDNPSAVDEVLDDTAFGGSGTQQEIYTNNGGANQIWATY